MGCPYSLVTYKLAFSRNVCSRSLYIISVKAEMAEE